MNVTFFQRVSSNLVISALAMVALACGSNGSSTSSQPLAYAVTMVAGPGGTLSGNASQTVPAGGSTTPITAVPNTGYAFTNWTGSGFTTSTSNPLTLHQVASDLALTANFSHETFSVDFAAGTGGSITGAASQLVAYGGSTSAVTAVPNAGFAFVNWTGTGFTTSASNPLTIANVTAPLSLTANFVPFTVVPGFTDPSWQLNGTAQLAASQLQLTDAAGSFQAGSAFWKTQVPTKNIDATFDVLMADGSGADGICLVFGDPTGVTSASLGASGFGLAVGGLPCTALALDTYQNSTDPSSNFMGITDGTIVGGGSLNWLQTLPLADSLRGAPHHIHAILRAGHTLTVELDGTLALTYTGTFPANVLIGFTGSTGGSTDRHVIQNVQLLFDPTAP